MLPFTLLSVGFGGAIGAMLRYAMAVMVSGVAATLAVNIIGSFLMGCAAVYLSNHGAGAWQPFIMTGVLGGFTTFSAFSLDAMILFERGDVGQAALYVVASVVLSIMALVLGIFIVRGVLP